MSSPSAFESNPYTPTSSDSEPSPQEPTLIDRLIPHLYFTATNLHTSQHQSPLEFFHPTVRRYNDHSSSSPASPTTATALHGAQRSFSGAFRHPAMRAIPSAAAKDGYAVVQDWDIATAWRLPSVASAYELLFWETAFKDALGSYTAEKALEAFIDAVPRADEMELEPLLQRLGEFLTGLGTQPITIDIPLLVEEMARTWTADPVARANFSAFAWLQSGDIHAVLHEYILTREFLYFSEDRMPFAEVTFYPPMHQSADDSLILTLDFGWSPPTISFEDLKNVFAESEVFVLKPKPDRNLQSLQALNVEYRTELGAQLPWDHEKGQFEGRCPPELAGFVGAGRLEAFTVPLNMSAIITRAFPGGVYLERAIRLVVPVTIKRKPDTCQGDGVLSTSPEVRRPAFSQTLREKPENGFAPLERHDSACELEPKDDAPPTKATPVRCHNARAVHTGEALSDLSDLSHLTPRELTMLLRAKAKMRSPGSPLRFDALSMARLWEASGQQHSLPSDIECWAVHVDSPPTLPDHSAGTRIGAGASLSPNFFQGLRMSPSTHASPVRSGPSSRSVEKGKVAKATDAEVLCDPDLQSLKERVLRARRAYYPPSTEREQESKAAKESSPAMEQVDSPMQDDSVDATRPGFSTPHASPTPSPRTLLKEWKSLRDRRVISRSSRASDWRVKNWRQAPEKLNDAEKDVLQKAIRESYKKMQEEKGSVEKMDESEIDGADSEADVSFEC